MKESDFGLLHQPFSPVAPCAPFAFPFIPIRPTLAISHIHLFPPYPQVSHSPIAIISVPRQLCTWFGAKCKVSEHKPHDNGSSRWSIVLAFGDLLVSEEKKRSGYRAEDAEGIAVEGSRDELGFGG